MLPPTMRPGGCTRRMIDNAVTDFPLPDSPTSPSVSPLRISKLTSSTAGSAPDRRSNTVVRCSTTRSGWSLVKFHRPSDWRRFLVFAEDSAHGVGDLAHRRLRLYRGDDRRHEVA